ncbi:LacI family DNA-binding transcriptional regulator [Paraglaciecola sp. Hal342]
MAGVSVATVSRALQQPERVSLKHVIRSCLP